VNLHRDVGILRGAPLLQDLAEEQLQLLAFNCGHRSFRAGQYLFRKDESAMSAFVIVSGEVEVLEEDEAEQSGGRFGAGTVLDEFAMIVRAPRPASARALSGVEAMEIPRTVLHRVLEEFPDTAERMRAAIAARLGALVQDMKTIQARFEDEEA